MIFAFHVKYLRVVKCKNHLEENQTDKLESSFSIKYSNIDVNIIFSIILANIGSKFIGG